MKKRKNKVAVALHYDEETVPTVGSVGLGDDLTGPLRNIARRYGIPVEAHSELAEKLSQFEADEEIPPDLYLEVARILKRNPKKTRKKR